jgi:hypothetical protein
MNRIFQPELLDGDELVQVLYALQADVPGGPPLLANRGRVNPQGLSWRA